VDLWRITAETMAGMAPADLSASRADGAVLWADVQHTNGADVDLLAGQLGLHPMAVEECRTRSPVAKVHLYADHVFISVNGVVRGDDGHLHFLPIKAFVAPGWLVTIHGPTHAALPAGAGRELTQAVLHRMEIDRFHPRSGMQLGHAVVMMLMRRQEELVASLAGRITELERRVMASDLVKADPLLDELFALRHDLQMLRTNAAQNQEAFARLRDSHQMPADALPFLEDLYYGFGHLKAVSDLEREYLQELLDLFQTRISNDLNRFVRQLTAWGAIGIAGTLVVGVYGMNFTHMPELDWRYGYPMALGIIVLIGLVLAAMFRKRGWL
jgi:magnesium transporter